jgi:hippurate hydrolase
LRLLPAGGRGLISRADLEESMPVVNRVAGMADEIAQWRREFHTHPELCYEERRTARKVAETLQAAGCDEVVSGIGRTGVVGVIRGRRSDSGRVIGLRADMDALPIEEASDLPYKSQNPGVMHACGHDGHTAMLLGAAKYLAETRNFDGTAVVIFQPAEEGGAGAKAMIDDGLLDRWNIQEVYGMHNTPGLPVGEFAIRPGPLMAAADRIRIEVEGRGGHAAWPHDCADPIVAASAIVLAAQSIVSRNVDPLQSAVVSITMVAAGHTDNVIPQSATMLGTARTFDPAVRDLVERRLQEIVAGTATAYGVTARFDYKRDYPAVVNHADNTAFAARVAAEIAGTDKVDTDAAPRMGAEDFAFMLNERPGAFIFAGNGDTAPLHNPAYNFNDELIPVGVSYWARLVETRMPA